MINPDDENEHCEYLRSNPKIVNRLQDQRRAYYSELVSNATETEPELIHAPWAIKKTKYTWKVLTEKYAPVLDTLPPPVYSKTLAPAERWFFFETDKSIAFPIEALKPKVQLQFYVEPGRLPRKVEVERKRRQYCSQNIKDLLTKLNVTPVKLLPVEFTDQLADVDKYSLLSEYNFLPLDLFDDDSFEKRSPYRWLEIGQIDNVRHPVPGDAFLPNRRFKMFLGNTEQMINSIFEWVPVAVTNYNAISRMYSVITMDGTQRTYKVPRILLKFKAEDPENFANRIAAAVKLRNLSEHRIRYEFYIDCMPTTDVYDLSDKILRRVIHLATRAGHFKITNVEFFDRLTLEIRMSYKRALNEMQFRHCVKKNPQFSKYVRFHEKCKKQAPEKACYSTGMEDFQGIRNFIHWYNLYVIQEPYAAMSHVVAECQKVSQMCLFTVNYGKYVFLDEFEVTETHATNNLINYLKTNWLNDLTDKIQMCLRDVGKGWFDLTVKSWEVYKISKSCRFMDLVKFRMESALRDLVEISINIFMSLVEVPCEPCLTCPDDFVWGHDLINSPFKPRVQPVFGIVLMINENGPYYSHDPDKFAKVLLQLYNRAIIESHSVQQLHPLLLNHLKFADDLRLSSVGLLDPCIEKLREDLLLGYEKAVIPLKMYAKEYEQFVDLFKLDVAAYIAEFKEEEHSAQETKEEVSQHFRYKRVLEQSLPLSIVIGPFLVNTAPLKTFLVNKKLEIGTKILDMFAAKQRILIEEALDNYRGIMIHLNDKPICIENVFEIREYMDTVIMAVRNQDEIVRKIVLEYDVLDHFLYQLPQEDFESKWEALAYPLKVMNQMDVTTEFLLEETEKFQKIQFNDEIELMEKIEKFTVHASQIATVKDISKTTETAVSISRMWKNMKEAQEQGLLLNTRQKLFNVPVIPFDSLNKLIKEVEPFKNLWVTAADWFKFYDIWMDNPLVNVDGESIDRMVTDMYKTSVKLVRTFSDIPACQTIALEIKEQIETFRPRVSLIQALRNPGLKERHWEQISQESGIPVAMTPVLTFKECLEMGLEEYCDVIVKIGEASSKEYAIENSLNKMMNEWSKNFLEVHEYKHTGTYIMKIADEYSQLLDDHIVMTQQISFSPFKKAFEEQIVEWEDKLRLTVDVIEEWIECQRQWMYLEPIFTSGDINRQLPAASKKYNTMERSWRRIMKNAYETPRIMDICPDLKLLDTLKDANALLEVVQKSLSDYLETKRTSFPRFYFLSDDELLEILAQAKNPLAVQPHLKKCFENIYTLTFEEDLKMTQMHSSDGECVDLNPPLYPVGNVEDWMMKVEEVMKNTVRFTTGESLKDLAKKQRQEWVLEWPGQIVIAGSQTDWTARVEFGLSKNKLPEYFTLLLSNLDSLRSLVKGSLSFLKREIVSALIVIEVHARDVTEKLLNENVQSENDFEWISQLRYYWVNNEHLKTRAVNAEFQYGYEYLGNSGRLVITPLTDRCYLTLTGALHLGFGGAPAGPAGTGKTETTKDLAKAIAIQCVVFNCSDQLDFMAMGKFFKGLASSGAWACFDEFNRIDIEVLSVVAQQIMTIQKAQQARLERFIFEESDIALKQSCAVFITMNPGYAGRTELPDNLKALFRPVAMMVPNYALIAEISLFSFGFSGAQKLAGKITTTFKLSSEQLSTQDHYDFGMRAVKTVIAVAGNLKREQPHMDERQIVLRALRDVNVPKFLRDDLKLFNGIVSDLFPRMVEEAVDYGDLEASIRRSCIKLGLEDVKSYVHKVIQLFETTVVRHGLMLVGPTGSGKSKCYEILKDALTALRGKPSPSGQPFEPVNTYVLNPKSITMGQLYGEFDLATHEWTDGILPTLVRVGAATTEHVKHWYVFDGPVDAVWIENMNTVLDDNKKLCLTSGEIIKLTSRQTMMFEVADLAVASPATVSRCGMVYLEPSVLGLQPFINCWLRTLPEQAKKFVPELRELFNIYLLPAVDLLRNSLVEIVVSVDSAIVQSFLANLDFRLRPLTAKDGRPPPTGAFLELMYGLLVPWVVFSLIWSIGATCDDKSRLIFSDWLRDVMKKNSKNETLKHLPLFPSGGLVYDYKLHDGGFTDQTSDGEAQPPTWHHWLENVSEFVITADTKYSDIEIPTIDNVRSAEVLGMLLNNERNVVCVGPTGTGKTLTVQSKLGKNLPKKFICDFIIFSARTSANQIQDLIDSKLDKRRKGVYGPPLSKRLIFFIDDFNMPALEVYGAQPPIELIRQWMDFKGWYDRRSIGEFRHIVDVNFVAAMGPPGGGRNPVTARLMRHFHYIAFTEMEQSSKVKIFGTIIKSWLDRAEGFQNLDSVMINTTLNVYNTILEELLPTPAKTHYTFNLRDLSKVFQGMLMFDPETIDVQSDIIRLWYHENCRVFQDRLVNDKDREWFDTLLRTRIEKNFKVDADECLGDDTIIYSDINPNPDVKRYVRIDDLSKLTTVVNDFLEDYNSQSTKPMKLVLFLDAMCHVCRISRVIRQPQGNALLLGMSGSGRQSLTRLSAHMADFICFQIELSKTYGPSEWRDDIKSMMLKAGMWNRELVFLFSDTQIKSEGFLEDLNNILNSGDVPNIYQVDELDRIFNAMKSKATEQGIIPTKTNLFSIYQKQIRANLHVVVTMSPIGEVFRARLRQFPALVNCCTINWFSAWPDSALQSVALHFLDDIVDLDVDDNVLNGIVVTCQFMHQSVVHASEQYLQELSRHNYVTPTSYLELLNAFSSLIGKKKGEIKRGVLRLKTGLDKLLTTSEEVKVLQVQLKDMKIDLEIAVKDAEVMIEKIAADTEIAEETKAVVEKEEAEASKKTLESQAIAEDAQKDLDEALPALMAAETALKALNKNDVTEVRAMKRPPTGVHLVMETICICRDVKPIKIPGLKPGEKILDYWEPAKGLLSDAGRFLSDLMNYDKESITREMIDKLKQYVENPLFDPAKIVKVSKACTSLCMWVHAMYKYYFVNMAVAPKKAALAQANIELEQTQAILAKAKAKMKEVMDGLDILNEQLRTKIEFKEDQERTINICEARMSRAIRLVGGLAEERLRWLATTKSLEASIVNVTGDILMSAGAVAYKTPFTDQYRHRLSSSWLECLVTCEVPHTPECTPATTLGEPVQIRQWQLDGLPRDFLSTENAVLVYHSRRWPLFIDPQGQANKWVKNMGKNSGLALCKLANKDLMRTLESCIRFGKPCLIENVGEELDPALDPILQRQVYREGGNLVLKLGDAIVPYNNDFRLFITTKLPNPHYSPEISIKMLVVNFTLVPSGMQDQMLALVVMQERPDLEEARSALVVSSAQMKQELKEIEDRILYKLSASEGSPVDDIDLIVSLEASKVKSEDIKTKVVAAEITQKDIDTTRALYIPVANRAQILFFCLADLSKIDPMYQYSLEWFTSIFVRSMAETEKSSEIDIRIKTINDFFTLSLYSNVCRSLFEKNKLQFAFLLCIRILLDDKLIDPHEWHFFLAGGQPKREHPNPVKWLNDRAWIEILALENIPSLAELVDDFEKYEKGFNVIYDSPTPHREPFPKPWDERLDDFKKMLVLKCIRPGHITNAMQDYLCKYLGSQFIEPQMSDLSAMYKESAADVPLVFVLSTGTDPASELYKFSDKMKMTSRMYIISLGQGQGPRAEKMFYTAMDSGAWVFFQNCHLAPSWMPRLEYLIENIQIDTVHPDFRTWLTSMPSPNFPVYILQNGSKMTVEPPRGIKANMLRSYSNQLTDLYDFFESEDPKVPTFKWLLFSLCLFHGVCLERRKFGPLGFNIPYEFTDGDLTICISQLHMFLLEYSKTPFKVLTYTAGHINYGGRVTDDWDRRCLLNLLSDYYRTDVICEDHIFDIVGDYHQLPSETPIAEYLNYIRRLPLNDDPGLFGLHANAEISYACAETYSSLSTLLTLQPRAIGGSASNVEDETESTALGIQSEIPNLINLKDVMEKYPVLYEESLNTVLIQEVIRYNRLLSTIHNTLSDLLKALKGLLVMSEALENMSTSLFSNIVPALWASKAYPSLKPLGAWVKDLQARMDFLNEWVDDGIPNVFWISGFYFPQAFLTGTLQNFARKNVLSIDSLEFSFEVIGKKPTETITDGCCIYGLYLEGARWDHELNILGESMPKVLYTEMPVIWLVPEENHVQPETGVYICPVYKTLTRAGTLSTTGHSTNYVLAIEVPSKQPQSHWIKRGCALFCALDY